MKTSKIYLMLIATLFVACTNNGTKETLVEISASDIANLESNESYVNKELQRGVEYKNELKEVYHCTIDNPLKKQKVKLLLQSADEIDNVSFKYLSLVNDIKTKQLNYIGCVNCIIEVNHGDITISNVDLKQLPETWTKEVDYEGLTDELFNFCREITSNITNSHFKVVDDQVVRINEFSFDLQEFPLDDHINKRIDNQLKANPVKIEDVEDIRYLLKTVLVNDNIENQLNTLELINYLTIIERRIMSARAVAMANLRMRIGGC